MLAIRKLRKGEKMKSNIGIIKLGKARKAPPMVQIDITMDDKTEELLVKAGLEMIKKDREGLVNYAFTRAIKEWMKG